MQRHAGKDAAAYLRRRVASIGSARRPGRRLHFGQVVLANLGLTHRGAVVAGFRNIGFEGLLLPIVAFLRGLLVTCLLVCLWLLACHLALLGRNLGCCARCR
ncbi:hypothetical protein B9Z07_15710 [Burkholderia cenocepacia]|uniref:Uncharacterized protein n=1 Tax=Burkholderia cenocepacia TaxID=95486 RepID=A0AAD0J5M6_9BURK|nr:hypothetical protein B9Z07_15710 [Burkholderia cenocepacia]